MTDELQTLSIGMDKPEERTMPPCQPRQSVHSVVETNANSPRPQPSPSPPSADLPVFRHNHTNRLPLPEDHYGDEDPASTALESTHCRANSDNSRFRSVAQKVVNQQAKLDQLRQDVDVLRDSANYAWECKKHQYGFVQSSMANFVKAAREMLVEVPAGHSLEGLNQLLVQVQGDIKVVTEQIDSSTAAEVKLGNKQFCLREREQKFAAAVQETLRTLSDQGFHTRPTSEISSPNSTSQVDAASSVHPLLEKFYASVEGLQVSQERLADLQAEFEEEKINRQLREDQGQSPKLSDEEFEAAYTKQIQDAASVLTDAEKELAYLREECAKERFPVVIKAFSPPMGVDVHADGESETSEEGTPSSLAFCMPVVRPGALSLLHLKDTMVFSDTSPNRILESYLRGVPVDDSLNHGAQATSRSRVNDWLEQESGTTAAKDTDLTLTDVAQPLLAA
ncbi:hypothetical protein KC316_g512 [Hortaea werneckii]|nr:hypothetical protein KC324_g588 [Hortaea werneckii]KAI7595483.1 hypothetical protein KC316_g512 [Hortaea werneckii]